MTSSKKQLLRPDWYDKDPSEWPPEARTAFTILARIARRRLARTTAQQTGQKTKPEDDSAR